MCGNRLRELPSLAAESSQVAPIRKTLLRLDLSHNEFKDLGPQISTLYRITDLDVSHNVLTSISESMSSLLYLQTLNLSFNSLTSLPQSMRCCTGATNIDLSHNSFTILPPVLGLLSNLTSIDFSHNYLSQLPEAAALVKLTQLETLNLSYNNLITLSAAIGALKKLKKLNVSFNRLESLDENFGSLSALIEADFRLNALTSLPPTISKLKQLRALHLEENKLAHLPEDICACRALQHIGVARNEFTHIPTALLMKLPRLLHWDFSFNPIRSAKDEEDTASSEVQLESNEHLIATHYRGRLVGISLEIDELSSVVEDSHEADDSAPEFCTAEVENECRKLKENARVKRWNDAFVLSKYHDALVEAMKCMPLAQPLSSMVRQLADEEGGVNNGAFVKEESPWLHIKGMDLGASLHEYIKQLETIADELTVQVMVSSGKQTPNRLLYLSDFDAPDSPLIAVAVETYQLPFT